MRLRMDVAVDVVVEVDMVVDAVVEVDLVVPAVDVDVDVVVEMQQPHLHKFVCLRNLYVDSFVATSNGLN
jgi:hypothetical protein